MPDASPPFVLNAAFPLRKRRRCASIAKSSHASYALKKVICRWGKILAVINPLLHEITEANHFKSTPITAVLVQNLVISSLNVDAMNAVWFSVPVGFMVPVDDRGYKRRWVVQIFQLETLKQIEYSVGGVEIIMYFQVMSVNPSSGTETHGFF